MTQISVSGVGVEFGATTLLSDVTFTVGAGERWGIVGRNGTGKTTLLNIITGRLQPTRGAVSTTPGLRISLLEQHRDFGGARTVWEAVAGSFAHLITLERSLHEQAEALGRAGDSASQKMLDRYSRDLEAFERQGGYTFASQVDAVLHGLGFDPEDSRTRELSKLSGGERGRVGLARQLAADTDVLLLDEPTNHLDLETAEWLEGHLRETPHTVLLISHDRAFLDAVVDHVLHVEHRTATPYAGDYAAFVEQRTERRLAQQRAFDKQRRVIAGEEDYIRRNIAGQNSKQAKGRRKRLERLPRLSPPPGESGAMSLRFEAAERGGDQVLVAEHVTVSVPSEDEGRRVLLQDFGTRLRRGDRVGLVGPNGAGKSTLLRAIAGEHPIDAGELRVGNSTTVAYYRQDLAQVPTDRSLYDIIHDLRPLWERGQIQGHLGRFGFSGDEVQRRATTLSGGERARVALAMMVLSRANLLVLDEPTNHLDVESIEALEDAVLGFEGSVLLVSHDRELLRALTTRVWSLHDRRIEIFDGTFGEWEVVAAERREVAETRAAEQETARRAREREASRRDAERRDGGERSAREAVRRAVREVEQAEIDVAAREARVAELTAALADPTLYDQADGARRSAAIGAELDAARHALDGALERWSRAHEALDALNAGSAKE